MIKHIFTSVIIILLCINIVWGANLKDPHLLFIRDIELVLFLVSAFSFLGITLLHRNIKFKVFTILCMTVLLVVVSFNEYEYQNDYERIVANPSNRYSKINRRLIIGFKDKDEAIQLSKNGIAGIFLTKRNIQNETFSSLKNFISGLQRTRKELGLPLLIIATDQEGGPVSRLSPIIQRQEALALVHKKNQSSLDYGRKQGELLNELGVTVNFSPVVDLKPQLPPSKLDFHSLIATRAISSIPQEVINVALPYIVGLQENGVTATLKHFPGLARVQTDTHHFSASIDTDLVTLENTDWLPFTELLKKSNSWLMLSHVILKQIDPINPVSTSKKVVDELLRSTLKIDNILVTDDLTMGATYNRGFCKSVVESYLTSINYLLIAYDYEKYFDAVICIDNHNKSKHAEL
ncbi:MAG: glycoside hydrolase family 3 N-terminal domain-containing protein [Pseudomonadota bacterium]